MSSLSVVSETKIINFEAPKKFMRAFEEEATANVDSNGKDLTTVQYKNFLNAIVNISFLMNTGLQQELVDELVRSRQQIINVAGNLGYNRYELVRSSLFYTENKALFYARKE